MESWYNSFKMSTRNSAYTVILFYCHLRVGHFSHYHISCNNSCDLFHKRGSQKLKSGNIKGMALSFSGGEGRNTTNFQEDFFLQPIDQIWVIHQREQDCSIWLELIQTSSPGGEVHCCKNKIEVLFARNGQYILGRKPRVSAIFIFLHFLYSTLNNTQRCKNFCRRNV